MTPLSNYYRHFVTITKHKWYVAQECFKRGLYWQGIVHDLSKYSPVEFFTSARYYQGTSTPIAAEKKDRGYSIAWLNHKARNKHHWEYWVDFSKGKFLMCPLPTKYVIEMACDMIGASKAYNGKNYTPAEPLKYFLKYKNEFLMLPANKAKLEQLLFEAAAL